jgi:RTX calcium-binding nonapeptide repeat (4 copies)
MATQLQDSLPVALSYSYGPETLNELLHRAFGSGADLIPKVEVSYGGAAYLASRDLPFGYWEPENPSISYPVFPAFLVPTIPIERTNFDDVTFVPGNNIAPNIWIKLTLPSGVEQTFQVATVPSHLPTYDDGRPTPGDIVAMAHGVVVEYGGTLAVNDCHNIATDIAAAAGATFDPMTGNTIDPTQNQEGGFWRIAYRGTDPGAISNWQTLVQPGDIVRMGWADNAPAAGKSHTVTVVEAADADGYIRVVDNGGLFPGAEGKIAEHDDLTNANSITIYRLASDQTYLVNGSDQADLLLGTRFNDRLVGGEGGDALYGGDGIDIADYHAAKAMVGADLMWPGLNLGEAAGDTYYSIEDLQGSAFGDHLNGDNSFNKIWGGRGDDQIAGRGGDDTIDGEEGTDTAYYAGRWADFAVSGLHANFTVTDRVAGREGTDTVYNVEYLHFDDGTYSIGDLIGDIAPAVTATDHGVRKYGDLAASSLFSVSDADGDAMTQYHFWDSTADATSGHFVVNGVAQGTNQTINVSAADLAHTTFQAGTTADDLWVQAFDGTKWSDWKEFHLTPPVNHAPEVTATDHGVRKYGDLAASSLFSVSDADGDAMTQYHFWDSTADATSGHFVVNGVAQGTNQIIDVSAAQLAQTTFQAGTTADDLWVQAYDGAVWSGWKEFHLTPPVNHAPVVTAADHGVRKYGDLAASSLFSVSDADGDAITTYRFYDATADGESRCGAVAVGRT